MAGNSNLGRGARGGGRLKIFYGSAPVPAEYANPDNFEWRLNSDLEDLLKIKRDKEPLRKWRNRARKRSARLGQEITAMDWRLKEDERLAALQADMQRSTQENLDYVARLIAAQPETPQGEIDENSPTEGQHAD